MKSWNEIRKAATVFSKRWKNAYDEKAQAQSFLKEFFACHTLFSSALSIKFPFP
jgi:hypothetical protein